ncbi:MAG: hypothetical protein EFT35_05125 [Methanophagales archaeon ANME-1-THS]|nr:MAG: hypothetical protein EFT35_05125 [Methanophagales archaeon ANME-1-THS]
MECITDPYMEFYLQYHKYPLIDVDTAPSGVRAYLQARIDASKRGGYCGRYADVILLPEEQATSEEMEKYVERQREEFTGQPLTPTEKEQISNYTGEWAGIEPGERVIIQQAGGIIEEAHKEKFPMWVFLLLIPVVVLLFLIKKK